jgi:hypothetical protein
MTSKHLMIKVIGSEINNRHDCFILGESEARANYCVIIGNHLVANNDYDVVLNLKDDLNLEFNLSCLNILHDKTIYNLSLQQLIEITEFLLQQKDKENEKLMDKYPHYKYDYIQPSYKILYHVKSGKTILYYRHQNKWNHQIVDVMVNNVINLKNENKILHEAIDSLEFILKQNTDAYLELKDRMDKLENK